MQSLVRVCRAAVDHHQSEVASCGGHCGENGVMESFCKVWRLYIAGCAPHPTQQEEALLAKAGLITSEDILQLLHPCIN